MPCTARVAANRFNPSRSCIALICSALVEPQFEVLLLEMRIFHRCQAYQIRSLLLLSCGLAWNKDPCLGVKVAHVRLYYSRMPIVSALLFASRFRIMQVGVLCVLNQLSHHAGFAK